MSARMRALRLAITAALLALSLAAAGCGDDDSNGEDAYTTPAYSAAAEQQDAQAKSDARNLVSGVEACYVDQMTYAGCEEPEGVTGIELGSEPGQVEVTEADDTTFTVVAHSESGASFTVTRTAGGKLDRTCEPEGEGGCEAGGSW